MKTKDLNLRTKIDMYIFTLCIFGVTVTSSIITIFYPENINIIIDLYYIYASIILCTLSIIGFPLVLHLKIGKVWSEILRCSISLFLISTTSIFIIEFPDFIDFILRLIFV